MIWEGFFEEALLQHWAASIGYPVTGPVPLVLLGHLMDAQTFFFLRSGLRWMPSVLEFSGLPPFSRWMDVYAVFLRAALVCVCAQDYFRFFS